MKYKVRFSVEAHRDYTVEGRNEKDAEQNAYAALYNDPEVPEARKD